MGRRGARLRPSLPRYSYPRLRLVIADRREHEASVLRHAAYRSDQLAGRGGASRHRRGASTGEIIMMTALVANGSVLILVGLGIIIFRELTVPPESISEDSESGFHSRLRNSLIGLILVVIGAFLLMVSVAAR